MHATIPTLPSTRTGWSVSRYGGPEVLVPVTRPLPPLGPKDVLIEIHASAVSKADTMMRSGTPKFARPFLGWRKPRADLSGTGLAGLVVATGAEVTRFRTGDAVFGEAGMSFGANASHITLPEDGVLMTKPDTLPFAEAAVLADGPLTSLHFLRDLAGLQPGEHVLILAGSGSLGSAAIQIAKALGATVSASASARNANLLADLGADHVIDYTTTDPMPRGAGYDVIFDTIGTASFAKAKPALAPKGRYLSPVLSLKLARDMLVTKLIGGKRALFTAAGLQDPATLRTQLQDVLGLIDTGRLSPLMDRSYPLSDLPEAHHYVATGRKRGNVVVE
jgi:NADPH:quinone reductase-like Zn-dependent oxidoreductase